MAIANDESTLTADISDSTAPIPRHKDEIEHHKDGSLSSTKLVEMQDEDAKNPHCILKAHGFEPELWELVSAKNSIWQAQCKSGATKTLYSSKITVKPLKNGLDYTKITEHFKKFAQEYKVEAVVPRQYEHGAELLVPCFYDVHVGKLAEYDETNNSYDLNIARERMLNSVDSYIDRLKDRKFEKILYVVGSDYFNCEYTGSTVAGTKQDNSCRYTTMFKKGVEILIEVIDRFAGIAPIEVLFIPGNHSGAASEYTASVVLEAWYRNSTVVTVDSTPTPRKYRRFGKNLLAFAHGDSEKGRIHSLMSIEAAEEWGKIGTEGTKEWLLGHYHQEGVVEKDGVIVRRIPSLSGSCYWTHKSGYSSKKRSMAFIYNKNGGLTETLYAGI
jgi:hypothetical protein